ncbi:MAG: hypothetical protein ACJASQ_003608 [Crocinitomicaceae bacterium]|jgi:hypothetical protein
MKEQIIGILSLAFTALFGSFFVGLMFYFKINNTPGFQFFFSDLVPLTLLLFVPSIIVVSPILIFVKHFKTKSRRRLKLNFGLLIYALLLIPGFYLLTKSFLEAFYIISPYLFMSCLALNLYISFMKKRTATNKTK